MNQISSQDLIKYDEREIIYSKLEKLKEKHSKTLILTDFLTTLLKTHDIEKVSSLTMKYMLNVIGTCRVRLVRKEAQRDSFAHYTHENGEISKKILTRDGLGADCFFMYCKKVYINKGKYAFIAVPIKYEGENIGAIIFEDLDLEKVNTPFLELFVLPAGLAIKNCLLQQQLLKEKQIIEDQHRKINDDLQHARKIQECILKIGLENIEEYKFYGNSFQAKFLCGDFYDYFEKDDSIVFYIADIAGHGVAASLLTIFLKQAMLSVNRNIKLNRNPERYLLELQKRFKELAVDNNLYIGIMVGILNKKTNKVVLANGGHNVEPIHIKRNNIIETYKLKGVPINNWDIQLPISYETAEFYLHKDDTLLLLTDGITEAQSETGEEFGISQVISCLKEGKKENFTGTVNYLMSKVRAHTNDSTLKDDISYLAINHSS